MIHYRRPIYIELSIVSLDVPENFAQWERERSEHISNSHISSRISSRVASGVILCFVGYIITLRATLARTVKFPRVRKGERGRTRTGGWMLRKFADDFPESVIRRSAGTRASFVSIKRLRGKPIRGNVYALCENGTRRGGSQTRSNNTTATIGRILMTLPALARDNRNGFIRFTYTPRDLSAFRPSRRYLALYRDYKEHLLSFIIAIPIACSYAKYELFYYGDRE